MLWWYVKIFEANLVLLSTANLYLIVKLAFIFSKYYVSKWNGCYESSKKNPVITK